MSDGNPTTLDALRNCEDLTGLANLLGYEPSKLSFILYKIDDNEKYKSFEIDKKDGSKRTINAPIARLKFLQSKLSDILYECVRDINYVDPDFMNCSFGFSIGKGIYENAEYHRRNRFVLNIDLSDFFSSIHIGRIVGFLKSDNRFQLNPKVAMAIGQIACHDSVLPQGSPCSPIIADLVGSILDARLRNLAKQNGCKYSRYADDITFSTSRREFPSALASLTTANGEWILADKLISRIEDSGFKIKASKTRMQVRPNRQLVTGLVVNDRVNIRREYTRTSRAICHKLFRGGKPFLKAIHDKGEEYQIEINHIEGILSHQYYIASLRRGRQPQEIQDNPIGHERDYQDLLIYKTFFLSNRPLIIPEGKTDRVYLRLAALKHFAQDPSLVIAEDGKLKTAFRTYEFPQRIHDVVGLAGGTGNMTKGLVKYHQFREKFKSLKPLNPVIFLVDNDAGGQTLLEQVEKWFGVAADKANGENFLSLGNGAYVVRTPPIGSKPSSYIEKFLPEEVLKVELSGKKFTSQNKFDSEKFFGKARLAQYVDANSDGIDFSGFVPLVNRLKAAISDFA